MFELIWIIGVSLALLSINLHKARLASPDPGTIRFGNPLRDAFVNVLAWAGLVLITLLAVQYHGLAPLAVVALLAAAIWYLRRRFALHPYYRYANLFAFAAPICLWLLLQRLVGDIPVFDFMTEMTRDRNEVPIEALLPEGEGS